MTLNYRRFQRNNLPYIEVENRSLIHVTFSVQYTTSSGSVKIKTSSVLSFGQMERIEFPANSVEVRVTIYNVSVYPNVVLKDGLLVINRTTCFEVNGTASTARVREVVC